MRNVYSLPENVCIDGTDYAVNTDFRVWIEIGEIIGGEADIFEKTERILKLCYKNSLPPSLKAAVEGIILFYACGKPGKTEGAKSAPPVVDFSEDAGMIGAAFYHDYGIDLWRSKLHWWQFRELFSSLGAENKIVKVMGWRGIDLSGIESKEEKKFYRKMKRLYRLSDKRSEAQKQRAFGEAMDDIFKEV